MRDKEMNIDWNKCNGLVPVVIQHDMTGQVLMVGFMNDDALRLTLETKRVTFYSRTKQRLWTKGESSGHTLSLQSMHLDCDQDAILCRVLPVGPTCHTGDISCFHGDQQNPLFFLNELTHLIQKRNQIRPKSSYVTNLFESGRARIAQKVGEEGVELALALMKDDKEEIKNECADLLFHIMVLLESENLSLNDVCNILKDRHDIKTN